MTHIGADVAKLEFDVEAPSAGTLQARGRMRTRGLVSLIEGKRDSKLETTAQLTSDGTIRPKSFRAVYEKPDRTREITIAYDEAGRITNLTLLNDGEPRDSDVPQELWANTVDPLTAILRLQQALTRWRDQQTEGSLSSAVFDGRKRWDFHLDHSPARTTLVIDGMIGFDEADLFVTLPSDKEPRILTLQLAATPIATPNKVTFGQTELELKD